MSLKHSSTGALVREHSRPKRFMLEGTTRRQHYPHTTRDLSHPVFDQRRSEYNVTSIPCQKSGYQRPTLCFIPPISVQLSKIPTVYLILDSPPPLPSRPHLPSLPLPALAGLTPVSTPGGGSKGSWTRWRSAPGPLRLKHIPRSPFS